MWAPSALLGVEVNRLSGGGEGGSAYRRLSDEPGIELPEVGVGASDATVYLEDPMAGTDAEVASTAELSGIYFGILNIYTTLPQFCGTFIATIVFSLLEPGKSPELSGDGSADKGTETSGPNAIAVCLFIGAMSTVVAAFATHKLSYI